ncbi:hypothetical protein L596_021531 [Steinernema carpocapsae]|uniref:Aquaporin n=1 Tax=Steinernema carpocapsae TaxID=34508 RepID=A0A4U5MJ29_STECR|nr:hypothetical protein L596_021531 [Steinernema carpocapsae]
MSSASPRTESSTLSVDLNFPDSHLRNTKTHYIRHPDSPPPENHVDMPISNLSSSDDSRPYTLINKLVAEFVGDMIFVFIGSLSALSHENPLIHAAFAHGITIFVLVASLGHIRARSRWSPAVTLSAALARKMKWIEVPMYWAAQLAGGFVGALWVRAILKRAQYVTIVGGATILTPGFDWYQGLIAEFFTTFILAQTVLMTAVDTDHNLLAPLAIGLTLTLDIYGAGTISGASMNPARSFGPCLAATIFESETDLNKIWQYHYIYWAGPFLGAGLAATLYLLFFGRGHNRLMF